MLIREKYSGCLVQLRMIEKWTKLAFLSNIYQTFFPASGDNVHFKILIPSFAAGAIIGKGGETIAQIQKDTGARIKMSKASDFYPGNKQTQV